MFDIGWPEIVVIAVVALVAIGPKELPRVLYEAGKWFRRIRLMAGEFQRHFSDIMHEAELDELRKQAQATRDLMQPKSLAELVDPGGVIRDGFDPTSTGGAGHSGSPGEEPVAVALAPVIAEVETPPAPATDATSGKQG